MRLLSRDVSTLLAASWLATSSLGEAATASAPTNEAGPLLGALGSRFAVPSDQPRSASDICDTTHCCDVADAERRCTLDDVSKDDYTLVFPRGATRCLSGSPYAFQVWRGDRDKLLFYMQGHGGCFNEATTSIPTCGVSVDPQPPTGVFNKTNADNPFRDFTIINALDCSGDAWIGNVTREYTYNNRTIVQTGQANARATIEWVKRQVDLGFLEGRLKELVVMGCSAGSLGTQAWGRHILDTLDYDSAALIPDSYIGVFPEGVGGAIMKTTGLCSSGLLSPTTQHKCEQGVMTVADLEVDNLAYLSDKRVPIAFVNTKVDPIQVFFYKAMAMTMTSAMAPGANASPTDDEFYEMTNGFLQQYNVFPHFLSYLVDGNQHCYTNQAEFYTTGPLGITAGATEDSPGLTSWVGSLLGRGSLADPTSATTPTSNKAPEALSSVCAGDIVSPWLPPPANHTYCSAAVYPKTLAYGGYSKRVPRLRRAGRPVAGTR